MAFAMATMTPPIMKAKVGRRSRSSGHSGWRYSSGSYVARYTERVLVEMYETMMPAQRPVRVKAVRRPSVDRSRRRLGTPTPASGELKSTVA